MKKYFLIAVMQLCTIIVCSQQVVSIIDSRGESAKLDVISLSDTLLLSREYKKTTYGIEVDTIAYTPRDIDQMRIRGLGKFWGVKGKFVDIDEVPLSQVMALKRHQEPAKYNPALVVGKNLKMSGQVSLGIGVPMLFTGIVLMGVGNSNILNATPEQLLAITRCYTAAPYLFATGAALTVFGIPLYVSGVRILDMQLNLYGSGAGIALQF